MLRTDEQVATVSSLNMRAERHGNQPVPACDINITFDAPGKVLDQFEKGLFDAFYTKEPPNKSQKELAGMEADGPFLRFNGTLGPLTLKQGIPGYKAEIVYGEIASSIKIALSDVKMTRVKAEPKDGGTCGFALQLQAHPVEGQYDQLALILQREVKVTLTPPSASELKALKKAQEEAKKKLEEGEEQDRD